MWRCGASIREYESGNVELPQRATSDLPRCANPEESTSGPGVGRPQCVSSIRLSNPLHKGMSVDLDEVCEVPLLFGITGLTRGVVSGMLPPQGSGRSDMSN